MVANDVIVYLFLDSFTTLKVLLPLLLKNN